MYTENSYVYIETYQGNYIWSTSAIVFMTLMIYKSYYSR